MYEQESPEAVKARILDRIDTGLDKREGSWTNNAVSAMAAEISDTYHAMDTLIPAFYLEAGSGPYIDRQAAVVGIYRKPGAKAVCTLQVTGKPGARIPAGATFYSTGKLAFVTVADIIVSESDTASGQLEAVEIGAAYNIGADEIDATARNFSGIDSYRNEAAAGGVDREDDEALLARYYARMRRTGTSGNMYHYEAWAMEVSGVGACRVFAKHNGAGSVKLVLAGDDMAPASTEAVEACKTHVEAEMPIGPVLTVEAAKQLAVTIAATVTVDGSTGSGQIQQRLQEAVTAYLQEITADAFGSHIDCQLERPDNRGYQVSFNRIGYLLLSIPGVIDYTGLTLNGETSNLRVAADQVPVLTGVTIS